VQQVFRVVLCWIDQLDRSSFDFSQRLDKPETEAGLPILQLNDHICNQWIS
jgi:hypothetical protein